MTDLYAEVAEHLLEIEAELRRLAFWEEHPPSRATLTSPLPFCHDTLKLTQWLQFVFLVRMKALIEKGAPLPTECEIAPYAEEYFRAAEETERLQEILADIDRLLTSAAR